MARETWRSRFSFIMATAGFAVGLGNIWRFPFTTGMNGGGAFLLVYLAVVLTIGIPLMTAEIGLGRRTQLTPLAGMFHATGSRTSPWNLVGWLGVSAALVIQSYYVMLIGWILGYFFIASSGGLSGATAASLQTTFDGFVSAPGPVLAYTTVIVAVLGFVVSRGLRGGLERVATYGMPVLFALLLVLTVRSVTFPGAGRGLAWYLTPDFSAVSGRTVLDALGQAFYSIGIGMAAAFGFGSYMHPTKSDVPGNTVIVVACDTGVALLAGLMMFPALFAFGLEPNAGPGLLFLTMTNLFAQMPAGQLFGGAFFLLLLLAAMTSSAAVHEVLTGTVTDLSSMPRRRAAWLLAVLFVLLATPIILSQGPWSGFRPFGHDLFALADLVATNFLLPAGGLSLALYTAFAWTFDRFREQTNVGAGRIRIPAAWKPLIVFVIPIAVSLVLLMGFGIL